LYAEEEFISTVLDGFKVWGAKKHDEIRQLICHVSGPFIDPLIDRLADEETMTMRQFLMALLIEIGEPAKRSAIKRLHDKRWYLVRNLVILLRRFNDPEVMQPLRFLIGHSHPKVHLEALKTYQHFNDPKTDRYLLHELQTKSLQRQLNAAFLSRNSSSPDVYQALLTLLVELENSGFDPDYELRMEIVKSLAEIGNETSLPILHQALKGRSLLRPTLFTQYKSLIVRSFSRYPGHAVQRILNALANEGKGDMVDFARTVLARLKRKNR
jgi:hypothetical protein